MPPPELWLAGQGLPVRSDDPSWIQEPVATRRNPEHLWSPTYLCEGTGQPQCFFDFPDPPRPIPREVPDAFPRSKIGTRPSLRQLTRCAEFCVLVSCTRHVVGASLKDRANETRGPLQHWVQHMAWTYEEEPYICPLHPDCNLTVAVKSEVQSGGVIVLPGRYITKPEAKASRRRFGVTVDCPGTSKDPTVAAAPHTQRVRGVVSSRAPSNQRCPTTSMRCGRRPART